MAIRRNTLNRKLFIGANGIISGTSYFPHRFYYIVGANEGPRFVESFGLSGSFVLALGRVGTGRNDEPGKCFSLLRAV